MDLTRTIEELEETQVREVLRYLLLLNQDAVRNAIQYVQRSFSEDGGDAAVDPVGPSLVDSQGVTLSGLSALPATAATATTTAAAVEPSPSLHRPSVSTAAPVPHQRPLSAGVSLVQAVPADHLQQLQQQQQQQHQQLPSSSKRRTVDDDDDRQIAPVRTPSRSSDSRTSRTPQPPETESHGESSHSRTAPTRLRRLHQPESNREHAPSLPNDRSVPLDADIETERHLATPSLQPPSPRPPNIVCDKENAPNLTRYSPAPPTSPTSPLRKEKPVVGDNHTFQHFYDSDHDSTDNRSDCYSPADASRPSDRHTVPDHLLPTNQPVARARTRSDEKSLDQTELFDPVDEGPRSSTPILDAVLKAKETIEQQQQQQQQQHGLTPQHHSNSNGHSNGHMQTHSHVPDYLITMNQPTNRIADEDNKSLDGEQLFDETPSSPARPSIMDAAIKAKHAQQQQQQQARTQTDASLTNQSSPEPATVLPGEASSQTLLRHTMASLKPASARSAPPQPEPPQTTVVQLKPVSAHQPTQQSVQNRDETKCSPPNVTANKRPASSPSSASELSSPKPPKQNAATGASSSSVSTVAPTASDTASDEQPAIQHCIADTVSTDADQRTSACGIFPDGGACYLVYHPVSGELNIHYSEIPIDGAVGVWTTPDIHAFKTAQNLGRSELIGNCAMGVTQERKNYYNGWCQFVKAARSMDAVVTVLNVGLPVDFYMYIAGTCVKAAAQFDTAMVDGVACLPRNAEFFNNGPLEGKKFKKKAKKVGALAEFAILSEIKAAQPLDDAISTVRTSLVSDEASAVSQTVASAGASSDAAQLSVSEERDVMPAVSQETADDEDDEKDEEGRLLPKRAVMPDFAPVAESPYNADANKDRVEGVGAGTDDRHLTSETTPIPTDGVCYLIYEPDSSGRLMLHYSKKPIKNAVGMWTPGAGKKISGFKFKQNLGKSILIGNCSAGVQGRKNYCSGWCQFVRGARIQNGVVTLWDPVGKGMMVDVWVYNNDNRPSSQSVKLLEGVPMDITSILAVACLPKNTPFYAGLTVDIVKWIGDADAIGAASRF